MTHNYIDVAFIGLHIMRVDPKLAIKIIVINSSIRSDYIFYTI